ncbi:MAG: hypothetical protein KBT20_03505 [Bacteroidales bacterium]|nr:hypothetical protein [Candidatus Liminaster caballi]
MNVLIVSNEYTKPGRIGNPIINRIIDALRVNPSVGSVDFVPFRNRFSSFSEIRSAARRADIIHIQFGGLYAFLIWFSVIGIAKPKLLTFHGTDIHAKEMRTAKSVLSKVKIWLNQKASFCSVLLFRRLGFVSDSLYAYLPKFILSRYSHKLFVQPLGVDYQMFQPLDKAEACRAIGVEPKRYALFSDKSGTTLKRRDIAEAIIRQLGDGYELLVMCGVSPDQVPLYLNACDFVLLTSDEEGSPNITREALSLNKRVFSVEVGDVPQQLSGLRDSLIISRDPQLAANAIRRSLDIAYTDNTRETLRHRLDFNYLINNLVDIYKTI